MLLVDCFSVDVLNSDEILTVITCQIYIDKLVMHISISKLFLGLHINLCTYVHLNVVRHRRTLHVIFALIVNSDRQRFVFHANRSIELAL
jgi:hypothetical protein